MVKAFHAAGIEVILDVVFNHTAEGDHEGPTFCYRGLANDDYYTLAADRSRYADFSGTGNTLDASASVVRRMILDSLRYWVSEMHVDGFRFDLAAVLSRDAQGEPLADPAIIRDIEDDPMLAGTKLIAEAWDAGGLYQVGSFVGDRWCEWNGRFRDDVRGFVKGDPGLVGAVAQRFLASPDIYGARGHEPTRTINFATCHDGFTLNDLVSYDAKRNAANGEDGHDGSDDNRSWGCGADGPTDDPDIERLRSRQVRNFLVIELLSMGVPMLLMGDEVRRTQGGNNNAYCQDNEVSWFDWDLVERHADTLAFTTQLIASRRHLDGVLGHEDGLSLVDLLAASDITFSGVRLGQPDLGQTSHSLALTVRAPAGALHLIFNAWWEPLEFELPGPSDDLEPWRRVLDTGLDSPHDLVAFDVAESGVRGLLRGGSTFDRVPRSPAGRRHDRSTPRSDRPRGAERARMADAGHPEEGLDSASPWYRWGPYLADRAWGSVREDYSAGGDAWTSFPHDHARSRAYRWNEDGLAGISDVFGRVCLAVSFWNGRDPILKERIFGLSGPEGNHGEDAKEYWWYLDALPSSAWLRWRYHYPQAAFPYEQLIRENAQRSKDEPEYELLDTGVFDDDRYWITEVHYAKADPDDVLMRIRVTNAGPETDTLHVLPTIWFRNDWSTGAVADAAQSAADRPIGRAIAVSHPEVGDYELLIGAGPDGRLPELLFCENETNAPRVYGSAATTPYPKDGINDHVVQALPRSTPQRTGTKAAAWYHALGGARADGRAATAAAPGGCAGRRPRGPAGGAFRARHAAARRLRPTPSTPSWTGTTPRPRSRA